MHISTVSILQILFLDKLFFLNFYRFRPFHYVMNETDSYLKLLPASILDIYKVFEHIDMLSIGMRQQPYTVILPTWLRFGGSDSLMGSQNDIIMSWLRLTATSNCFPHPCYPYTNCFSTLICCPQAYGSSLTQLYSPYMAQIFGYVVTCGVKMMSFGHG